MYCNFKVCEKEKIKFALNMLEHLLIPYKIILEWTRDRLKVKGRRLATEILKTFFGAL